MHVMKSAHFGAFGPPVDARYRTFWPPADARCTKSITNSSFLPFFGCGAAEKKNAPPRDIQFRPWIFLLIPSLKKDTGI